MRSGSTRAWIWGVMPLAARRWVRPQGGERVAGNSLGTQCAAEALIIRQSTTVSAKTEPF